MSDLEAALKAHPDTITAHRVLAEAVPSLLDKLAAAEAEVKGVRIQCDLALQSERVLASRLTELEAEVEELHSVCEYEHWIAAGKPQVQDNDRADKAEADYQTLARAYEVTDSQLKKAEAALREAQKQRDEWESKSRSNARAFLESNAALVKEKRKREEAERALTELEPLLETLKHYLQALKDHASDGCYCGGGDGCQGDCGPALAGRILRLLPAQEK